LEDPWLDEAFWRELPKECEPVIYRQLYGDLAHLTDAELLVHYQTYGRREGRTANSLRDRNDFAALIPLHLTALEIGPFCSPLLRGPNVSYFDVLSRDDLLARAKREGLDPSGIPQIDYVSPLGDLGIIDHHFDVALSSHNLEHQPDLVGHLQAVAKILNPGGAYFLLIPDIRYCFDHFIPPSNLGEVIVAHRERRPTHILRSVIEHIALITHNDPGRHWRGDHGAMYDNIGVRLQAALQQFDNAKGGYLDVHAWYFTPDGAMTILSALREIGLTTFRAERLYPTRLGSSEFWIVLRI
jgi:SAM-dependent methyltransferase